MASKRGRILLKDKEIQSRKAKEIKGGVRKAGGEQQEYLKVELKNVMISSYQL